MSELVVLTTYFNPCRYLSRRQNYDAFMQGMRAAGVTCITVECAFGDASFELPAALDVLQVRSSTLLWQKERLLNLAASWLPASCRYVAWLDCDILFDNKNWARELVAVLRQYPVAQVWETCLRQPQDGTDHGAADEQPDRVTSFAAVMQEQPTSLQAGRYDSHGHTGYGWAMRRSLFDSTGLYEAAISGSADHFMAHAIYGDYNFCIQNALKHDHAQITHLQVWGQRFYQQVQGQLGVVRGEIRHLWHGDARHRRYFLRMHDITDLGFNPWTDLSMRAGRPLEWHAEMHKPALRQYFVNYFQSRREDGDNQEKASHAETQC
ncbi:hypothetical protein ACO0LM_05485 [Undibacterium sp. Di26W]|uniref:hypothetical protein n=1 Tax=Undibacterium sp. Di26W TaxID=3413035 RepID=UPI003BF0CC1A